ncbi:MAG: hypothetical protein AAF551_08795, partial [Bacteroidota bacterium]
MFSMLKNLLKKRFLLAMCSFLLVGSLSAQYTATAYRDADRDGHGDPSNSTTVYFVEDMVIINGRGYPDYQWETNTGWVLGPADDCDDTNPTFWQKRLWYEDADGDGLG